MAEYQENYQKFFDSIYTNDLDKIEKAIRELTTEDFILHEMREPKRDVSLDLYFENFKKDFLNEENHKINFVNCFSVGDMMAASATYEFMKKESKEKVRMEIFFIDRFEGDKIVEEWVW